MCRIVLLVHLTARKIDGQGCGVSLQCGLSCPSALMGHARSAPDGSQRGSGAAADRKGRTGGGVGVTNTLLQAKNSINNSNK